VNINQTKVTTMKKLYTLTAAAGVLLALAGPTLAAQRAYRAADAYASAPLADRSGGYYYGPQGMTVPQQARAARAEVPAAPGQSLPYADRPYGNPDRW
jgi:hypothetical protein